MNTLFHESCLESLRLLRLSEAVIPTITLPLLFYWLSFGLFDASGYQALAGLVIIAAMSPGAFSGAIYVASERQSGWLSLRWQFSKWRWWLSKQIALVVMAVTASLPVLVMATIQGHVELTFAQVLMLLITATATSLLFTGLGIICGLWLSESGAIAITNLIFFPLVLVSGVVIPLEILPLWLANISSWLPPHQFILLSTWQLPLGLIPVLIAMTLLTLWSISRCKI